MAEEENKPKRYRRTNVNIQADIVKAAESLIKKKGFASMLVTELIKKAKMNRLFSITDMIILANFMMNSLRDTTIGLRMS